MAPVLFAYDEVGDVPEGVEMRDASAILPRDRIYRTRDRNSYAPFADMFRYTMLAETDLFWVDADVFARRAFHFEDDFLAAWSKPFVAIGVLSLPRTSPVLKALLDACAQPSLDYPWLRGSGKETVAEVSISRLSHKDLPYEALGPWAITWIIRAQGETDRVLPEHTHYPLRPRQLFLRFVNMNAVVREADSDSVHLYGGASHRHIAKMPDRTVPERSYLGRLLDKHGLSRRF